MRIRLILKLIGALTSKPYSFKSRPWELKHLESIDLQDSLGSNIKISYKGSDILRITPNLNESINEEWISDKARFSYDSLNRWRFTTPLVWNKKFCNYQSVSWFKLAKSINYDLKRLSILKVIGYLGPHTDIGSIISFKKLLNCHPNSSLVNSPNAGKSNIDNFYAHFLPFDLIKKSFAVNSRKVFLLVGVNLRIENPVLNLKLRQLSKRKNIILGYWGNSYSSTIYSSHLGLSSHSLYSFIKGKHRFSGLIQKFLNKGEFKTQVNFITGSALSNRVDAHEILKSINAKFKHIFKVYELPGQINGEAVNFNNLNFKKATLGVSALHYLLGTDDLNTRFKSNDIVLFQGHHNDRLRGKIKFILPSSTSLEGRGFYLSCLNFLQSTNGLPSHLRYVKEDWQIISFLIKNVFNKPCPLKNSKQGLLFFYLGKRLLSKTDSTFLKISQKEKKTWTVNDSVFKENESNYYLNSSFLRASKNMIDSSNKFIQSKYNYLWS